MKSARITCLERVSRHVEASPPSFSQIDGMEGPLSADFTIGAPFKSRSGTG